MPDVARDQATLELLRAQRSRLAGRMRWPWWYQSGLAVIWALAFAAPFSSRYLPHGVRTWPILVAAMAVACLMQWGLTRATGINVGFPSLRSPSGRPARIAIIVVGAAAIATEAFLIHRGPVAAAIVVAAVAVVAEMVLMQAQLRGIRQGLRGGGGTA
jgi:hypothetical protein